MDFALSDEEKAIRETARTFIRKEVMPLEQEVLRRERAHEPGLRLDEHLDRSPGKLSSAGRPSINMQIKIVDDTDNEVPSGVIGELCVRGEGVMKGYWNKPEESAWSLRGG